MKRQTDPDVLLLQAAADPTRLAILRQLSDVAEVCACDFTACCDVSQPTVSHHLKVLRDAGWIEGERRGHLGLVLAATRRRSRGSASWRAASGRASASRHRPRAGCPSSRRAPSSYLGSAESRREPVRGRGTRPLLTGPAIR